MSEATNDSSIPSKEEVTVEETSNPAAVVADEKNASPSKAVLKERRKSAILSARRKSVTDTSVAFEADFSAQRMGITLEELKVTQFSIISSA